MEDATIRKIMSIVGLVLAVIAIGPANSNIANLHGHTTAAAIWMVIFIVGMVFAWVSVTGTTPMSGTDKQIEEAKAAAKKGEEKGSVSNIILGILLILAAVFVVIISPSYIFSSTWNTIGWIVLIACGIVIIVFSLTKKKG